MTPDGHTQVTSVIIEGDYPNVGKLLRDDYTGEVKVSSALMLSVLDRMALLAKDERSTAMSLDIGEGKVEMRMDADNVGTVVDELSAVGGQAETFKMKFQSDVLRRAIQVSGEPQFTFKYGPTNMQAIELSDGTGFRSIIMPMRADS
jgi:DNA polymerase III sliding clamp (beta) subunit (PCNA family)